ncbi:hypothetical protein M426DRAFT_318579 [Hypoxylon sp. CI-4A]|nr:hypothetical protein M426DRAFT_318579 [Hypoxylon sp. CI-4A]
MDSAQARANAVRDAVTSISTCTPAISAAVKELLQTNETSNESSRPASRARPPKHSRTLSRANSASTSQNNIGNGGLTAKEKAVLATQIITAGLKALGEAAKAPSSSSAREPSKGDTTKPPARTAPRRSNSAPMKPLQTRSLNRVSTSPVVPKTSRPPTPMGASTGCLSLIECARTAFLALFSLESSKSVHLPELQLEGGMSSFINKLIGLNQFEAAAREIKTLKRRIERAGSGQEAKGTAARAKPEPSMTSKALTELLDFSKVTASGPLLSMVISTQLQSLRVIHGLKKSAHLESILPLLRDTCQSSPMNLLQKSLKDKNPDQTKCARQLESLSQSLLSLTPGIAAKDDDFAVEPKLSPSPEVALEIQALGLVTRLQSWSVSGHRGDVDKEIILPLSKCLAAFTRRASSSQFSPIFSAFSQVWKRVEKLGLRPTESSRSPLAAIYQILANTSRESGNVNEAKKWLTKIKALTNPSEDSMARCCAVTAQLLALSLKQSPQVDESLLMEVLDGLRGTLGGTTAEMDDLLIGVCLLRKSAMSVIVGREDGSVSVSQGIGQSLETFIFQLPRFTLRWLGKQPSSTNATKDLLRFEQRRMLLASYLPHILDSALMLAKTFLDGDRLGWEVLDSTLQDILAILENMGDLARPGSKCNPSPSYHVKVSHFYYQYHLILRKSSSKTTETTSLKALRKSVDSVKNRSEAEQSRAQLLLKWERFADLCRASGRLDDAIDALRSVRDHLVRQDVVSAITASLATEPWSVAWQQNSDAELLSRTVCNLAKLDRKHNDWTWLLVGLDKATVIEHDIYAIISKDHKHRHEAVLSSPIAQALLQIYSSERYPIRRLRTLLQLTTLNMDSQAGLLDLRSEIDVVLKTINEGSLADDSGLVRYIPHLQALAATILGLIDSNLDSEQTKEALSSWKLTVSKCKSAEQLLAHIDNASQLLAILQSLIDFARVKGLENLQTELLELSIHLSKLTADCNPEVLVVQGIALSQQHLSLGWSSKAESMLKEVHELISQPEITKDLEVNFHLSAAEYHLSLGALDKAEQHMYNAQNAEAALSDEPGSKKRRSSHKRVTIAYAYSLCSNIAIERGDYYHGLRFARTAVRKIFHEWSRLEEMRSIASDVSMEDASQSEMSEKDTSLNNSYMDRSNTPRASTGPEFWTLAHPLFRFLLQLSSIYSHVGMYQETLYYAEQAQKVAQSMESIVYLSQSHAWLAQVWLMAGKLDKTIEATTEAKSMALSLESTYTNAKVLCSLSYIYGEIKDSKAQLELLNGAETMLKKLVSDGQSISQSAASELESKMAGLSIEAKPAPKVATRRAVPVRKLRAPSKAVAKKPAAKKANPPVDTPVPQAKPEDVHLSFLRRLILQIQSTRLLDEDDWATAVATLRTVYELSKLPSDISQACFLMGMALVKQSLDQIGQDAVFSLIQDSTLSFPSVAGSLKERSAADQSAVTKTTTTGRGRGPSQSAQNKTRSFVEKLREAQGHFLTAQSIASLNGDGNLVHRIATVLQNVVILLSNTNSLKPAANHPAHAICAVELARNLTWRRERKTVHLESPIDSKIDWPIIRISGDSRRTTIGFSLDMDTFQREYVDIIPKSWNVISISISDNEDDLCITKLQSNQGPFGIRLPLERASTRDADSEVFNFRQGRAELLEIIKLANRTCHDARDMSQKGAKSTWWAEREQIDERMKNLMECMEQTWLGGFKGIFSQHHRHEELVEKFQKAFDGILDKYLPSRRQVRSRKKTAPVTKVSLDPRVYDLIIGLGDPTAPDSDLDEPFMDLLYFVIDILSFHGERNAYDEIDIDDIAVETLTALNAYYIAAKNIKETENTHTILILDKSLHAFPWESLPCLQNLAVSRVPSLDCLRRLILEAKSSSNGREGHYASINSGTYILNPSSDLKNTQATFGKPLSHLPPAWDSIEMREPTETEFESALTKKDLLLYFGHGSGAQYIRGRTIRKMDKCRSVAMLMGCSSASLADPGRFECHGPVWNYMLAGSPAVVGTLWDVTDRDIDRFAGRVFEEWGLMPKGTFVEEDARGKGKKAARGHKGEAKKSAQDNGADSTSLVEAVMKARDACRFRYLTAAAVCVYGIPVYVDKQ